MLTEQARLIHLSRRLTDDVWENDETLASLRPDHSLLDATTRPPMPG